MSGSMVNRHFVVWVMMALAFWTPFSAFAEEKKSKSNQVEDLIAQACAPGSDVEELHIKLEHMSRYGPHDQIFKALIGFIRAHGFNMNSTRLLKRLAEEDYVHKKVISEKLSQQIDSYLTRLTAEKENINELNYFLNLILSLRPHSDVFESLCKNIRIDGPMPSKLLRAVFIYQCALKIRESYFDKAVSIFVKGRIALADREGKVSIGLLEGLAREFFRIELCIPDVEKTLREAWANRRDKILDSSHILFADALAAVTCSGDKDVRRILNSAIAKASSPSNVLLLTRLDALELITGDQAKQLTAGVEEWGSRDVWAAMGILGRAACESNVRLEVRRECERIVVNTIKDDIPKNEFIFVNDILKIALLRGVHIKKVYEVLTEEIGWWGDEKLRPTGIKYLIEIADKEQEMHLRKFFPRMLKRDTCNLTEELIEEWKSQKASDKKLDTR